MKCAIASCSAVLALALTSAVKAEDAPASPHTFTANVSAYSQYVFRGLTQTNEDPTIQGGFDYAHASGFYAGTWLSNISWFSDTFPGNSSSLEWDFYTGFKKTWAGGLTTDVGYLRYQYPGTYASGIVKPNTDEAYVGLGYKWATLKYSYAFSDDVFGIADADGTYYLDLTVAIPLPNGFSVALHAGQQSFTGGGGSYDALLSYEDYKASVSYAFGTGWTVSAAVTTTNAEDAGYTILGKNLGDDHFIVGLSRAF